MKRTALLVLAFGLGAVTVIDGAELDSIIAAGEDIHVSCQFCDREYRFSPAELIALRDAKRNAPQAE